MDVKKVVALAKSHLMELFSEEKLTNVGLEEVEFQSDTKEWVVTLGFSRPWDKPSNTLAALAPNSFPRRSYKVLRVKDENGEVLSLKNLEADS